MKPRATRADREKSSGQAATRRERWELLRKLETLVDWPMVALSFVWLALVVVDFTTGLNQTLQLVSYGIWALFALHFVLGLIVAPDRGLYVRQNWLTALALLLPAFRVLRLVRALRVLRAAQAARSVTLLRLVTSLNRGMGAVSLAMGSRGVGYVAALTLLVTVAGAAGMAQFESPASLRDAGFVGAGQAGGLPDYWEALWWTAMMMTTMGSDYWPKTLEGRLVTLFLSVYAFAVFGYITATIASLFLDRKTPALTDRETAAAGDMGALTREVAALRAEVVALTRARPRASGAAAGATRWRRRAGPPRR